MNAFSTIWAWWVGSSCVPFCINVEDEVYSVILKSASPLCQRTRNELVPTCTHGIVFLLITEDWLEEKRNFNYYTPVRMAKIRKTNNAGLDVEQQEFPFITVGNVKCTATLEDSLMVSYKTYHTLTIWSSSHIPWYLPKGTANLCPHKNLHKNIYSSLIHNYQNLEATKMSFSRWMDK